MKLKHMYTFGCPVFALQNELSSGGMIPHWSPCTRLGINLGSSPAHARNVYLILNLHTGCISPQFHCRFDNFYGTVKHGGPDISVPSLWQQLAGLVTATQSPSMEFHDESRNQFNMSLVTMQSLLQATHQPSPTTSSWTSFTSTTANQLPQRPRNFKFPTLLPRKMLVFLPKSPWVLELAQEVEQERCHEPERVLWQG